MELPRIFSYFSNQGTQKADLGDFVLVCNFYDFWKISAPDTLKISILTLKQGKYNITLLLL